VNLGHGVLKFLRPLTLQHDQQKPGIKNLLPGFARWKVDYNLSGMFTMGLLIRDSELKLGQCHSFLGYKLFKYQAIKSEMWQSVVVFHHGGTILYLVSCCYVDWTL
jgi:hypothetical protein